MNGPVNKLPEGFSFSQSSLQDYMDCPRRFDLRYIQQLAWPAVESEPILENERRQQAGQYFHRLIQQHLLGLPSKKLEKLAATPELKHWWSNFISYDLKINGYAQYTEAGLFTPIGDHRLTAKYDLVAISPDQKAIIFDWKTYHKRPRDEGMAARMQTRVYRALLAQAGAHLNSGSPIAPDQIEMVYWYAEYPDEPARLRYSQTQFTRDWDALTQLVTEISRATEFPMTNEPKKCTYCPYRSFCERGIKASEGDETEKEIAGMDIDLEQVQEIEF